MADEVIFDPTLKKKKKKKKIAFDLDDQLIESSTSKADEPVSDQSNDSTGGKRESERECEFKLGVSKDAFCLEELEASLPERDGGCAEADLKASSGLDDELDFSTTKKKKKKKVGLFEAEFLADIREDDVFDDGTILDPCSENLTPWSESERDYTYDELLKRAFEVMLEKNPDIVAGEKKKFVMKPPKTLRVGSKKTSFANFLEICRIVHRQPKHVQAFVLTELGTSGSIDGNNQLIIRGRFQQRQIETVLRSYVREYVTCHTCHSPDTILEKDTRLFFLKCETCGSRCSVSTIKSGFQAVTGKRAAMRQKSA